MQSASAAAATIFSSNDGAPRGGETSVCRVHRTVFKATAESRYAIAFIDITGTAASARVDNNDSSEALPVAGGGRAIWLLDLMRARGGECVEFIVGACDAQGRINSLSDPSADRIRRADPPFRLIRPSPRLQRADRNPGCLRRN